MIDLRGRACKKIADKLDSQIMREYFGHCVGRDCISQRPTLQRMLLHVLDTLHDAAYLIINGDLAQFARCHDEMRAILQKNRRSGSQIIYRSKPSEDKRRLLD
jgi:hypothetical protein